MIEGTITAVLCYCASVTWKATYRRNIQVKLQRLHRTACIHTIMGYRTISAAAAGTLANILPFDLRIRERALFWLLTHRDSPYSTLLTESNESPDSILEYLHRRSISEWQERWSVASYGRWTYHLFPNVQSAPENVDFYLTQALTAHGCFGAYLHTRRRRDSPSCPCGAPEETIHHVAMECPRFSSTRVQIRPPLTRVMLQYLRTVVLRLWALEQQIRPLQDE